MLGLPMNLFPLRKQNTYLHRKLHIQGDARFTLNALDTAAPPNGAKQGPLYLVTDKVHFSMAKWFWKGRGGGGWDGGGVQIRLDISCAAISVG